MSPVQRAASSASASSRESSVTSVKAIKSGKEVPFVRKRLLSEQTMVLAAVFEEKTHPTREDRAILAAELGMQLKTVSAWFQNRRRTLKKRSLVWRGTIDQENRGLKSTFSKGSGISLDHIAAARERPIHAPPRTSDPFSPLSSSALINFTKTWSLPAPSPEPLWEHIPSSPPHPPSSPAGESVRLAALGRFSNSSKSLEWACETARKSRKTGTKGRPWIRVARDVDVPLLDLDDSSVSTELGASDTETEEFEAITPDTSAAQLLPGVSSSGDAAKKDEGPPAAEDMEAAMALLGFMGNP